MENITLEQAQEVVEKANKEKALSDAKECQEAFEAMVNEYKEKGFTLVYKPSLNQNNQVVVHVTFAKTN